MYATVRVAGKRAHRDSRIVTRGKVIEKKYYFVFSAGKVLVIDREQNASIAECQNSYQAGKIVDALNLAEQKEGVI